MFDLSELDKLKETRDKRAIPTVALYLDENRKYTGKYEVFESRNETSRTTGVGSGSISGIINQIQHKYTATHRNGRKVTFVNAYATEKEVVEHLKRVEEVENDPSPIPTKMMYLNENKEYTGEYATFESEAEASRVTGVSSGEVSEIINPKKNQYTTTHNNGRKVTFVDANATQKDVDRHLKRVKEIEHYRSPTISVKIIYLDENNEPTGEYEVFESRTETSRVTGVADSSISDIINQRKYKYTATNKNGKKITFVNADATEEEIKKHIQRINNR